MQNPDLELFQFGDFTLASGRKSRLKIECDAISMNEWHMLARLALPILSRFGRVIGVPHGGLSWAEILNHYIEPGNTLALYADDVWTTGGSMRASVIFNEPLGIYAHTVGLWHGLVLFARGPVPENVTALFQAHKDLE